MSILCSFRIIESLNGIQEWKVLHDKTGNKKERTESFVSKFDSTIQGTRKLLT